MSNQKNPKIYLMLLPDDRVSGVLEEWIARNLAYHLTLRRAKAKGYTVVETSDVIFASHIQQRHGCVEVYQKRRKAMRTLLATIESCIDGVSIYTHVIRETHRFLWWKWTDIRIRQHRYHIPTAGFYPELDEISLRAAASNDYGRAERMILKNEYEDMLFIGHACGSTLSMKRIYPSQQ